MVDVYGIVRRPVIIFRPGGSSCHGIDLENSSLFKVAGAAMPLEGPLYLPASTASSSSGAQPASDTTEGCEDTIKIIASPLINLNVVGPSCGGPY